MDSCNWRSILIKRSGAALVRSRRDVLTAPSFLFVHRQRPTESRHRTAVRRPPRRKSYPRAQSQTAAQPNISFSTFSSFSAFSSLKAIARSIWCTQSPAIRRCAGTNRVAVWSTRRRSQVGGVMYLIVCAPPTGPRCIVESGRCASLRSHKSADHSALCLGEDAFQDHDC